MRTSSSSCFCVLRWKVCKQTRQTPTTTKQQHNTWTDGHDKEGANNEEFFFSSFNKQIICPPIYFDLPLLAAVERISSSPKQTDEPIWGMRRNCLEIICVEWVFLLELKQPFSAHGELSEWNYYYLCCVGSENHFAMIFSTLHFFSSSSVVFFWMKRLLFCGLPVFESRQSTDNDFFSVKPCMEMETSAKFYDDWLLWSCRHFRHC